MSNENNNNGLYFMVGGLLVAVMVIGALYLTQTNQGEQVIEESNTVVERTVEEPDVEPSSGSSFEFNVDDEGFNASSETEETQN
jgi:hypothetical protein